MIRQKHADPDLHRCEHCGSGPTCAVCNRGAATLPPRMIPTDRRGILFRGLRWEVFNPRTGETWARTRTKLMAALLAYAFRGDYAPSGMGW